jgi:hypothetical protein
MRGKDAMDVLGWGFYQNSEELLYTITGAPISITLT